jgi:ankyrin repeat protein
MKAIAHLFLCFAMVCVATSAMAQQQTPEREPTQEEIVESLPPLMRAAAKNQVDEVRRLLKEGADVNQSADLGFTALIFASMLGHLDVIKILLDAGADPNGVAGMSHPRIIITPLLAAMVRTNKKRLETIDVLIAGGAKVNPPAGWQAPLYNAVTIGDVEMVKAILERGANVDWPDQFGRTPLAAAFFDTDGPDVSIVKLLLDAGANPNKSRLWVGNSCMSILESLNTSLRFSKTTARLEAARLLIQHGAKRYRRKAPIDGCYPSR